MRGRSPEVDVEHAYSDDHRERDKDHGEEEIFAQQGNGHGRRGDDLRQQQEEHGQRQQDGDGQGHLEKITFVLPTISTPFC